MLKVKLDDSDLQVVLSRTDLKTECYIFRMKPNGDGKNRMVLPPLAMGFVTRYAHDPEDKILARWMAFDMAVKDIPDRKTRTLLYKHFMDTCRVPWKRKEQRFDARLNELGRIINALKQSATKGGAGQSISNGKPPDPGPPSIKQLKPPLAKKTRPWYEKTFSIPEDVIYPT